MLDGTANGKIMINDIKDSSKRKHVHDCLKNRVVPGFGYICNPHQRKKNNTDHNDRHVANGSIIIEILRHFYPPKIKTL